MSTRESSGQPAPTTCCSHFAYLPSFSTMRNFCGDFRWPGASISIFREADAYGGALLYGLAIAHHGLVAPLRHRERGGVVESLSRAGIGDHDVAGRAIRAHGEFQLHPARAATHARQHRVLGSHIFEALQRVRAHDLAGWRDLVA